MKRAAWLVLSITAPIVVSLFLSAHDALAGPPLLCHALEIGDANSLPWGDGEWENGKIEWTDEDFVSRTLALLSPDAAILTRMETIRRATIHAAEHPKAARALMAAVRLRFDNDESPDANVLFDLGYLSAAYAQMNIVTDHNAVGVTGGKRQSLTVPEGLSVYDLLRKSASLAKDAAPVEFALALVTMSPLHPDHKGHIQRAVSGASEESLLATNLVQRFGRAGQSLADLRTSFGNTGHGERR